MERLKHGATVFRPLFTCSIGAPAKDASERTGGLVGDGMATSRLIGEKSYHERVD
jgi:hypothetical protein